MKSTGCPNGRLPVLQSNVGQQRFTNGKAFGFANKVNETRSIRTVLESVRIPLRLVFLWLEAIALRNIDWSQGFEPAQLKTHAETRVFNDSFVSGAFCSVWEIEYPACAFIAWIHPTVKFLLLYKQAICTRTSHWSRGKPLLVCLCTMIYQLCNITFITSCWYWLTCKRKLKDVKKASKDHWCCWRRDWNLRWVIYVLSFSSLFDFPSTHSSPFLLLNSYSIGIKGAAINSFGWTVCCFPAMEVF